MSLEIEKKLKLARSFDEVGKNDEAQMYMLELLKEDPNNHAALLMLGGSYFVEEKYSESEMVFERLILMEPGEGRFSIALFNALLKAGRTEEALEEIWRFVLNADRAKEKATIDQYMKITNLIAEDLDQDNRSKNDLNQNR
ncbi:MAG: tetratricopeptide repeat protein [Proteobacteria bacterium]|nr:tetratricopeptide repeat protein [Pseudomonadota bacterium]